MDDTYLIIPAANTLTSPAELAHIEAWAAANNLQLKSAKTKEIEFRSHRKRGKDQDLITLLSWWLTSQHWVSLSTIDWWHLTTLVTPWQMDGPDGISASLIDNAH